MCSTLIPLFTLLDSNNTLDSIFIIDGFPHLSPWFSLSTIDRMVSSMHYSILCMQETYFVVCPSSFSFNTFKIIFHMFPCVGWWGLPYFLPSNGYLPINFNSLDLGSISRVFIVPWGLQPLVERFLTIDSGNTSISHDRYILQVFYVISFIHICENVLGNLMPIIIIIRLSHAC